MSDYSIKNLLLGISGGIAAYKSAELVRLLVKQGINVHVVMTEAATHFVTPLTFQALSGNPVHTELWDDSSNRGMAHIDLSRSVDAILIAPASADFIAKLVHGHADDLLSTLCLARDCPLYVAPAMNRQMWQHPATQRNIQQLHADGVQLFGPDSGAQACGETGMGRMLEAEELLAAVLASAASSANLGTEAALFAGKRILITAGPTVEPLDPVRAISNHSSGKMGYSVTQAAIALGAEVTLISGPVALQAPPAAHTIKVNTAVEMLAAVESQLPGQDIFIAVAAVADYRPQQASVNKLKKSQQALTITLEPNPDILATIATRPDAPFCVGFAAETENLLTYAEDKRRRKNIPLIAANIASEALGQDASSLVLLDDAGSHPLPHGPKIQLAHGLLKHIAAMLPNTRKKA